MNRIHVVSILILSGACLAAARRQEPADTANIEVGEVVVVGTRTYEKIIDIPFSVFKVDKKELSFGRKISARDVLADVPGLFLQSRYGNHDLRVSIRGFGTRSNSGIRGVRILQDGVPESEPDGETVIDAVDFTSLGGVEVVKGNLSSLYANAPGGVINFVSDLYFPRDFISSVNQAGEFGMRQNGFRTGLRRDNSRFLLSYNYRSLRGYRLHSEEYQHVANSVYEAYLPASTVTVLANYVNGLIKLPGSLTAAEFDSDPFQAYPLARSQDFRRITRKGRLAVRYRTSPGGPEGNDLEVTGYGGIKDMEKADAEAYTAATRYSLGTLARYTASLRVLERRNKLTLGMDYAFQSGPVTAIENVSGNRGIEVKKEHNGSLSNIGFYFLNQLNLAQDRLDLFVSGRYDKDVFAKEIFIPYGSTDTSRTFEQFTPKFALNFKLTPSVAAYASYGLSFDFPALSELDNTPLSVNTKYSLNPGLSAQTSRNIEAGVKGNILNAGSRFMKKLFFDVTLFQYLVEDEIVPFVINQTTYYRNAAKTRRLGLEAAVKAEPVAGIELTVNATFTRFRYDEYQALLFTPSGTTTESYAGNEVPSVPSRIVNFILNYELELSEKVSGLLQWDCDYIASMEVNDANTERTPGYFYGNALAGANLSFGSAGATLYAGIGNIFDKRYAGFLSVNEFYGRYYETGEPRNVYGGLTVSFAY